MKTMTCRELGGGCDQEFTAETFKEIAEMSKEHGIEMLEKKDPDHLQAMQEMQLLIQDPEAMQRWLIERMEIFESR